MAGVISRKEVRDKIALGLTTAVTAAQAVYSGQPPLADSETPCIRVYGSGSARPAVPASGRRSAFRITIQSWVLLYDRVPGSTWTAEKAEDALDTIEQQITEWIGANQRDTLWTSIEYAGPSIADNVILKSGETYIREDIFVEVKVHG